MIKISKDELFNYELPAWWNKKRIEDEEITTMRKLIGRKDFTVDVICEHLRVATSCWEEYIKSLCEVNKMLLAGINVSEIIVLLQDNKYSSYGGENYIYSQLEIEAYEKLISKYCTNPVIITDINIIVPNKVVEVTFADGKKEKMVCHEEDTFNLRNCLFIAIAKQRRNVLKEDVPRNRLIRNVESLRESRKKEINKLQFREKHIYRQWIS